jgi:hypothetical protein
MLTDDQINAHELFSELAELVIGVPIESLPESKQEKATEDVQKFIRDFLIAYTNETFGKFPSIRVLAVLNRDKSIIEKFPEISNQLHEALVKLVESL